MDSKRIIAGIIGVTLIGGSLVLDPGYEQVEWKYSQSVPRFDTPSGNLTQGQYGVTDTGQILYNRDGTVRSLDEDPAFIDDLEERQYLGVKYQDVFEGGVIEEVTAKDYADLETNERLPVKTKFVLAKDLEAAIVNEATNFADSSGFVNSLTLSIDCTETDRGVVTGVANRVLSEITGATHNGDAMTSEVTKENTNVAGAMMFSRTAADSGTNNVVVSLSAFRLLSVFNICLSGTDQTDMIEATGSDGGFGSTRSVTLTTLTNGAWVMSTINSQGTRTFTPDAGETELNDSDHSDGSLGAIGVSYLEDAVAGSETIGWTISSSDNAEMVAVAIKPASGGGGGGEAITTPSSTLKGGLQVKGGVIIK
jgi:hypothetical protein